MTHVFVFGLGFLSLVGCGARTDLAGPVASDDAGVAADAGSDVAVGSGCPPRSEVNSGLACSLPGITCPSNMVGIGCNGQAALAVSCNCAQGAWTCTHAACVVDASIPPVSCPDAATLVQGTACSGAGLQCRGNPTLCNGARFYDALRCDGTHFVTVAMTVCGVDGG